MGLEIGVGEEGRPVASHRQEERGLHRVAGKRLAAGVGHAPLRPFDAAMLNVEIGFLPRHIGGNPHLLHPWLASPPAELLQHVGG